MGSPEYMSIYLVGVGKEILNVIWFYASGKALDDNHGSCMHGCTVKHNMDEISMRAQHSCISQHYRFMAQINFVVGVRETVLYH